MESLELKCKFCSRDYNIKERKPRLIFQCGHNICNDCLIRYLNSSQENFICPLDGEKILIKKKNIETFPINFNILEKVQDVLKKKKNFFDNEIEINLLDDLNQGPNFLFHNKKNSEENPELEISPIIKKKNSLYLFNEENKNNSKSNVKKFDIIQKKNSLNIFRKKNSEKKFRNNKGKILKLNSLNNLDFFGNKNNLKKDSSKNFEMLKNKKLLKKDSLKNYSKKSSKNLLIKNPSKTLTKNSSQNSNNIYTKNSSKNLLRENSSKNSENNNLEMKFEDLKNNGLEKCSKHKKVFEVVCTLCKEITCYECVIFGDHKNHKVIKISDFLNQSENKLEEINNIYDDLISKEEFIIKKFFLKEIKPILILKENDFSETINQIYEKAIFNLEEQKIDLLHKNKLNFLECEKQFNKTLENSFNFDDDLKNWKEKTKKLIINSNKMQNTIKSAFLISEESEQKFIFNNGNELISKCKNLVKNLKDKLNNYLEQVAIKENFDFSQNIISLENPLNVLEQNLLENESKENFQTYQSDLMDPEIEEFKEIEDLSENLDDFPLKKPRIFKKPKKNSIMPPKTDRPGLYNNNLHENRNVSPSFENIEHKFSKNDFIKTQIHNKKNESLYLDTQKQFQTQRSHQRFEPFHNERISIRKKNKSYNIANIPLISIEKLEDENNLNLQTNSFANNRRDKFYTRRSNRKISSITKTKEKRGTSFLKPDLENKNLDVSPIRKFSRDKSPSFLKPDFQENKKLNISPIRKLSRSTIKQPPINNIRKQRSNKILTKIKKIRSKSRNRNNQIYLDSLLKGENKKIFLDLKNHKIEKLTLKFMSLNDNHIYAIAPFFIKNKKLKNIILKGNRIKNEGASVLGTILYDLKINSLDLSWNSIKDKGAEYILELCRTNRNIRKVNLKNNDGIKNKEGIREKFFNIGVSLDI